ncbi:MAG: DNA repair protein RecO [Deltaproteobacteria bacterium]|nr:DNA repair protein RecO [Deltaproteobacteria bacterium]
MRSLLTEALLLRSTPYRDADAVVQLLTPGHGVVSLLARGARSSRRRFGGVLDYFCRMQAELRPARQGLGTLLGVELLGAFEGVRGDVDRYWVGCHFLEIARGGAREADPAPELYALLAAALGALDRDADPASLQRVFQVKGLVVLGYGLPLESCPACVADLARSAAVRGSQVVCRRCAGPHAPGLSVGALETLRAAARLPLDRLATLRVTAAAEAELGGLLDAALGAALGRPIRPGPALAPGIRD